MRRKPKDYKLAPRARADLETIWLYTFQTWSIEQADQYHKTIVAGFEALASGRRDGRPVNHVRPGYFRLSVGSHFVFYRENSAFIEIVRILHQRQDFERHL